MNPVTITRGESRYNHNRINLQEMKIYYKDILSVLLSITQGGFVTG